MRVGDNDTVRITMGMSFCKAGCLIRSHYTRLQYAINLRLI